MQSGQTYPSLGRAEVEARFTAQGRPVCQSYLKASKYKRKGKDGSITGHVHVFRCALQEYENLRTVAHNKANPESKVTARQLCRGGWKALVTTFDGSASITEYVDHCSSSCHPLRDEDVFSRHAARGLSVVHSTVPVSALESGISVSQGDVSSVAVASTVATRGVRKRRRGKQFVTDRSHFTPAQIATVVGPRTQYDATLKPKQIATVASNALNTDKSSLPYHVLARVRNKIKEERHSTVPRQYDTSSKSAAAAEPRRGPVATASSREKNPYESCYDPRQRMVQAVLAQYQQQVQYQEHKQDCRHEQREYRQASSLSTCRPPGTSEQAQMSDATGRECNTVLLPDSAVATVPPPAGPLLVTSAPVPLAMVMSTAAINYTAASDDEELEEPLIFGSV
mmetsp:Transcript_3608/g.7859  ORF Transcript_3608/g.7859 Transcript_3608/m.7859 type:complete len:396 (+) Transcript_3608:148-1335(+)